MNNKNTSKGNGSFKSTTGNVERLNAPQNSAPGNKSFGNGKGGQAQSPKQETE